MRPEAVVQSAACTCDSSTPNATPATTAPRNDPSPPIIIASIALSVSHMPSFGVSCSAVAQAAKAPIRAYDRGNHECPAKHALDIDAYDAGRSRQVDGRANAKPETSSVEREVQDRANG